MNPGVNDIVQQLPEEKQKICTAQPTLCLNTLAAFRFLHDEIGFELPTLNWISYELHITYRRNEIGVDVAYEPRFLTWISLIEYKTAPQFANPKTNTPLRSLEVSQLAAKDLPDLQHEIDRIRDEIRQASFFKARRLRKGYAAVMDEVFVRKLEVTAAYLREHFEALLSNLNAQPSTRI